MHTHIKWDSKMEIKSLSIILVDDEQVKSMEIEGEKKKKKLDYNTRS